jgi:hypothetical protein
MGQEIVIDGRVFTSMEEYLKYRDEAVNILSRPTPRDQIKQREGGKKDGKPIMLDYVEGSYVIRVLNHAFGNHWSWKPIHFELIPSQPKVVTKVWDNSKRKMVDLLEPRYEQQPPVAHVVGELTIPGFGSRTGFGSKTVIGGASEQESMYKAASTDALKKAATLFGIALDLYEDAPVTFEEEEDISSTRGNINNVVNKAREREERVEEPQEENDGGDWDPKDITKLQQLMKKLSFAEKSDLDPYIKDFSEGELQTWEDLNPQNIKPFLIYLERVAK